MKIRAVFVVLCALLLVPSSAWATDVDADTEAASEPEPEAEEEIEEEVDFDLEEENSDAESAEMIAAAGGGPVGGAGVGFKLFVDFRLEHRLGADSFEFKPNHTYVFLQVSVYDELQLMLHVSDDPIFFELSWTPHPNFTFRAGKLLVPFGTNEFHHIIGGRVDEQSHFLPETWGDYGLAMTHLAYDGADLSLEYTLFAVNGFSGVEAPNIASGSASDNNFNKGIGLRVEANFLRNYRVTGSAYYDVWDAEDTYSLLFYALGAEAQVGPVRLRGEWGRGEVMLPAFNYQQGILPHAYARAGYFAEAQWAVHRRVALRLRVGRINPDNTVTDANDVEVYEPAVLIGLGSKLWWTIGYQITTGPGFDHDLRSPADVLYAKLFLQY